MNQSSESHMPMAQSSSESVAVEDYGNTQPPTEPTAQQPPQKLKGRKRLLLGLQRISSSSSLSRHNRTSSTGYRGIGRGSVSCISLTSASSIPNPYNNAWATTTNSNISNGYSTAPTSVPGTPGVDSLPFESNTRVRFVRHEGSSSVPRTPMSIALPSDVKSSSRPQTSSGVPTIEEDYFSRPVAQVKTRPRRKDFDFWGELPTEIALRILQMLRPKEIVRSSLVSKRWHSMCFDGQLWASLDTSEFYRDIPAQALSDIITRGGPFLKDLNLRGCVQLFEFWRMAGLSDACRNLEHIALEGCRIDRSSIHNILYQNARLQHINLCGLAGVTNSSMKIISQYCPKLEHLDISWCNNVDARGLRKVIDGCPEITDLRIGELRGLDDPSLMLELHKSNKLERLILNNCDSLTDESLVALMEGQDGEIDYLTGRRIVPPRKLKHLDLSRCRNVTDTGIKSLAFNVPDLEGLQLSKCSGLTDASLTHIIPTFNSLTHLDLEELELLTNATLQELAKSPSRLFLEHLGISYCENLGDTGMLPLIKSCPNLRNLDLDNTRISDLVLTEAASMVRKRNSAISPYPPSRPKIGLRMVVYDCQHVTWNGIREVLSRNAEIRRPNHSSVVSFPPLSNRSETMSAHPFPTLSPVVTSEKDSQAFPGQSVSSTPPSHPQQIISLKVFYGYQPTVTEHTRRVLRGDLAAASRLERKWAEYMMASEEAGISTTIGMGLGFGFGGMGNRRRRRRYREAQMMHADEEEGGAGSGIGRRRRARSGGGCTVM